MKIRKAWETLAAWSTFLEVVFLAVVIVGFVGAALCGFIARNS